MRVLIIGSGVIGTTYGYIFQKEGHDVEHLIRDDKKETIQDTIKINLLDGRLNKKGQNKTDNYNVKIAEENSSYDFIFISVSSGKIENVLETLNEKKISGTLVIMSGIWKDKKSIDSMLKEYKYIFGYPVAGGNKKCDELNCCVFDHIMLERKEKSNIDNYDKLLQLLESSKLKVEIPFDMIEWIWIHIAINAAVITTAARYGDVNNPSSSAKNLMASSKILAEAVLSIRETLKIVRKRNVNLKNYNNELFVYKIPSRISGIIMKRMFKNNNLTREIMTLHNNIDDLFYVAKSVYYFGKKNKIDAPIFYENYENLESKIKL